MATVHVGRSTFFLVSQKSSIEIHGRRLLKRYAFIWKLFSRRKKHAVNVVWKLWREDAFTVLMHAGGIDVSVIVKHRVSLFLMWLRIGGRRRLCTISKDMILKRPCYRCFAMQAPVLQFWQCSKVYVRTT